MLRQATRGFRIETPQRYHFLQGTVKIGLALLCAKLASLLLNYVLIYTMGLQGVGLWRTVVPISLLCFALAGWGIPIALSKQVASCLRLQSTSQLKMKLTALLSAALWLGLLSSLVIVSLGIGLLLSLGSLLPDSRVVGALYAILPILPVLSFSYVYQGYFLGAQRMSPYSLGMVVKNGIRIGVAWLLALWLLPLGFFWSMAGVMTAMLVAELASCWYFRRAARRVAARVSDVGAGAQAVFPAVSLWPGDCSTQEVKRAARELWRHAFPITASRSASLLAYAVEGTFVLYLLPLAGLAIGVATAGYGYLAGAAISWLMGPEMMTQALAFALLPAISEAMAQKDSALLLQRAQQALRLALVLGLPWFLLFLAIPEAIATLLYGAAPRVDATVVAQFFLVMALPFGLSYYLQGSLAAMLQGMGEARRTFYHALVGAAVKLTLLPLLILYAEWGLWGVVAAICSGMTITTCLHAWLLVQRLPAFVWSWRGLIPWVGLILLPLGVAKGLGYLLPTSSAWGTLGIIALTLVVYGVAAYQFRLVRRHDWEQLWPWRIQPTLPRAVSQ